MYPRPQVGNRWGRQAIDQAPCVPGLVCDGVQEDAGNAPEQGKSGELPNTPCAQRSDSLRAKPNTSSPSRRLGLLFVLHRFCSRIEIHPAFQALLKMVVRYDLSV